MGDKRDKQSDKGGRGEPAGDLQPGRLMTASWRAGKQSTRLPCPILPACPSCPVVPRTSLEREVKQAQSLERGLVPPGDDALPSLIAGLQRAHVRDAFFSLGAQTREGSWSAMQAPCPFHSRVYTVALCVYHTAQAK